MKMAEKLLDIVKTELEVERRASRFEGQVHVEEKEVLLDPLTNLPVKSSFFGVINQKSNEIKIGYKPNYEEKKPGKTISVVTNISRHEVNHRGDARTGYKGCPKTLERHLEFYEIVKDVLLPKGYSQHDVQYVVNAFEDFIDNVNLFNRFDSEGFVRIYEDVAEYSGFSEFLEAFVKLNGIFAPNRYKKIVKKFYKHKPEVKETLENFLNRSGLSRFKKTITENGKEIQIRDLSEMVNYLNGEENWDNLARIFTEEFSRLMTQGYALPIPGLSGAGTKGREDEKEEAQSKGQDDDKGEEGKVDSDDLYEKDEGDENGGINWKELEGGNIFDKEMQDPDVRKDEAYKQFRQGRGRPEWLSYYESLDAVYQKLAKRLNIKAHVFTKTTQMPLTWYGKKKFDPKRDRPKHLGFGFNDKGEVEIKKQRWHYDIPLDFKDAQKGFPEVRFVMLDTSGSMEQSPDGSSVGNKNYIPWGTNSKYHYALLAWYGFVEYLKQNHLLKKTTTSLANFSCSTVLAKGLEDAKRMALKPQFGNTYLDTNEIKEMFQNRGTLIFTISDGEIANWDDIKSQFINEIKNKGHYYFHIQLGNKNEMTTDLKNEGIPVYYVKGENDLWRKVIEVSDAVYRKKEIVKK